jgi:RsiW-degrading membrane proteinase PrsW (M82 family)
VGGQSTGLGQQGASSAQEGGNGHSGSEAARSVTSAAVLPTPVGTSRRVSLTLPAFWMLLALLTIGAWRVAALAGTAFTAFPRATVAAAVLFTLYAVPFVIFARSVDFLEREPGLLVAAALGWGGLVATTTAISGNDAVHDLLAKLVSPSFAASWGPAISAPAIEELLKTLGVVVIVLVARKQVNSVVDGAVYGAFVGLGFQVIEDFIYAVNAVAIAGRGDSIAPVIVTFFLRGFLAGLWSHTMFSALAGAGVAYFVVRRNQPMPRRLAVAAACVFGAWAFHFVWNSPLLADGFGYGGAGVLIALLVKGIPALLMVLLLVRIASGSEADFYLAELVGDLDVATPKELAALRTGRRRMAARRYAYARCGRAGRNAVGSLQKAQARLAVEMSRDGDQVAELRQAVLVQRRRLVGLRHAEASAPPERRSSWAGLLVGMALSAIVAVGIAIAINALGGS